MARFRRGVFDGHFPLASGKKVSIVYRPEDEEITQYQPATAEWPGARKNTRRFDSISRIAAGSGATDGQLMKI
jgi:hypothetical protein